MLLWMVVVLLGVVGEEEGPCSNPLVFSFFIPKQKGEAAHGAAVAVMLEGVKVPAKLFTKCDEVEGVGAKAKEDEKGVSDAEVAVGVGVGDEWVSCFSLPSSIIICSCSCTRPCFLCTSDG